MLLLLALAFLAVPIAELAVIIAVGRTIGIPETFALLVVMSLLGAWLARREGVAAWRRFQQALAAGRVPAAEVADGFMVLLAGALMLAPGFLTDVVAILLLLPPVRAVLRRHAPRLAARSFLRRQDRRRARAWVVDGTARPSRSRTAVSTGRPIPNPPPRDPD